MIEKRAGRPETAHSTLAEIERGGSQPSLGGSVVLPPDRTMFRRRPHLRNTALLRVRKRTRGTASLLWTASNEDDRIFPLASFLFPFALFLSPSASFLRKQESRICICMLSLCALLLVSCAQFRPPDRNLAAGVELDEQFTMYGPATATPDRWWETFGSEDLNELVETALDDNFTVRQAVARIRQAAAVARQTSAARAPQLSFSGDVSAAGTRTDTGEPAPKLETATQKMRAFNTLLGGNTAQGSTGGTVATLIQSAPTKLQALETLFAPTPGSDTTRNVESYGLGLTTGYEVDFWGRLRALDQAVWLDLAATKEGLYTCMQTIAGQVVLTWLDILQHDKVIDVTRRQLDVNKTTLKLVELRYRKGMARALDVYQQTQAVARTRAALPPLEAQRRVLLNQLAVLLGSSPQAGPMPSAGKLPEPGPVPDPGVPADLLAMRPDVRAAGLRLRAADWRVAAARADRLPALQLTGTASYGAGDLDLIFDNWMAKLASSVTGPVFDAGRRKAEVERTRAVVDERLSAYKETVLSAVREVEDALVLETKQREYIEALNAQFEAARATHREALTHYQKGLNDYLPVLNALTAMQALERGLVQARHNLLVYRVQLLLALGGTWMQQEAPAAKG